MIKGGCQVGIQSTIGPVLSDGNIKQYIGINVIDSDQCLKLIAGKYETLELLQQLLT